MGRVDGPAARSVLGVTPDAPWPEVRAAYLRLVREHHPDGAEDEADAGLRTVVTAQVTEAYAVLSAAMPRGTDSRSAAAAPPIVKGSYTFDDCRRVLLEADEPDAFAALLEVFHLVGVVSYVDRSSAVLETIVTAAPGEATSLLAFLEPWDEGITEAILGVEPLGGHRPAPLDPLVDEVARLLASPRPPAPES
jgi:hypothetical protein